ncbi:MAG: ribose-phosphate pyrophosphokinase [Erysipelotrichia bacterium]|nr:ribose-phosphate pyrophosphokinase [Erysipelotrichia bacterium]
MINKEQVLLFSLTSCEELTNKVCKELGVKKSPATVRRFADNEVFARPEADVKDKDCIIIQSTCDPVNDKLMELLIFVDAVKRAKAKSITAIIPYFGYVRQDRIIDVGDPISVRLVANCLREAGVDHVVSVDYHSDNMASFFEGVKATELLSTEVFAKYYQKRLKKLKIALEDVVLVSPDEGGLKRATNLSNALGGLPIATMDKFRPEPNKAMITSIKGAVVADKYCLMIDDIVDTGGTIIAASGELLNNDAKGILICASHGIFSQNALAKLYRCGILDIAITDSIPQEEDVVSIVSLAPIIAKFIDENY